MVPPVMRASSVSNDVGTFWDANLPALVKLLARTVWLSLLKHTFRLRLVLPLSNLSRRPKHSRLVLHLQIVKPVLRRIKRVKMNRTIMPAVGKEQSAEPSEGRTDV